MNDVAKKGEKFSAQKFIAKLGPVLALLVLVVAVSVMNMSFLAPSNLLNLLRQVSINALIAFGMTFVILTGGIDLSVGSILALSGAISAYMIQAGVSPAISIAIGMLTGALFGLINGILVGKQHHLLRH